MLYIVYNAPGGHRVTMSSHSIINLLYWSTVQSNVNIRSWDWSIYWHIASFNYSISWKWCHLILLLLVDDSTEEHQKQEGQHNHSHRISGRRHWRDIYYQLRELLLHLVYYHHHCCENDCKYPHTVVNRKDVDPVYELCLRVVKISYSSRCPAVSYTTRKDNLHCTWQLNVTEYAVSWGWNESARCWILTHRKMKTPEAKPVRDSHQLLCWKALQLAARDEGLVVWYR